MMQQPEILDQSPWSFYEDMMMDSSNFDLVSADEPPYGFFTMVDDCGIIIMDDDHDHVGDCTEFSTLSSNSENNTASESEVFSFPNSNSSMLFTNDHHIQFPIDEETLQLPSLMELDIAFDDSLLSPPQNTIDHHHGHDEESEGSFSIFPSQNFLPSDEDAAWSPTLSEKSEFSSTTQPISSLILPQEGMEIENKVSLPHLMEAFIEALEQGQKALSQVILRCISQKATTPLASESLERLAFYLSQEVVTNHHHGDYLKGEASKNYGASLRAFYQGHPIGKVAHFAAVSAILEAISEENCDAIHLVDFCMGHGLQWPFLFEAIAHMNKTLKLTSIKCVGDEIESPECVSTTTPSWSFEETKRQLLEHAKSCGLKLKVEEKGLEELVTEIKRGGRKREFLAFNCMVGLPHMGMVRSRRRHALEFLKVAEDLIKISGNKGIITFGDGDAFEKLKNSLSLRSFFEGQLVHYQALLESIESHFPARFSEARTACEVLFVAPCVSSLAWLQTWEEMKRDCHHLQAEICIEGGCSRLSKNILMEVREGLRGSEGGSSYQARIEGQNDNELVLAWKGTQLLRFSSRKN